MTRARWNSSRLRRFPIRCLGFMSFTCMITLLTCIELQEKWNPWVWLFQVISEKNWNDSRSWHRLCKFDWSYIGYKCRRPVYWTFSWTRRIRLDSDKTYTFSILIRSQWNKHGQESWCESHKRWYSRHYFLSFSNMR